MPHDDKMNALSARFRAAEPVSPSPLRRLHFQLSAWVNETFHRAGVAAGSVKFKPTADELRDEQQAEVDALNASPLVPVHRQMAQDFDILGRGLKL